MSNHDEIDKLESLPSSDAPHARKASVFANTGHKGPNPGLPKKMSFSKKSRMNATGVVGGVDSYAMDAERKRAQAYDYLCHIGEAKEWIEACTETTIGAIEDLDEELRNGITLAELGKKFQPNAVKKIFKDKSRLQFRHSDNINFFISACRQEGLPEIFFFELTDLYEKKNIPKVIYCIHALSYLLANKDKAPHIKNLVGKLEFSEQILTDTAQELADAAVPMPAFGDISKDLEKEMNGESEEEKLKREEEERQIAIEQERKAEEERQLVLEQERQAEEERQRIIEEERKAEEERQLAIEEERKAEEERQLAIEEERKAEEERQLAIEEERKAEEERLRQIELEKSATVIQAKYKGFKERSAYKAKLDHFKSSEELFVKLQARVKGKKQKEAYEAIKREYRSKEAHIIKMQAWWKGNNTRKQYQELRLKKGQFDVKLVKKFVHLIESPEEEADEDRMIDELRARVIQKIRENITSEAALAELDSKVALLVKNRITLQEVANLKSRDMRAKLAVTATAEDKEGGVLTLKGSDKETKSKKKKYEQLFYLLQTEPLYLSTLMFIVNKSTGAAATKFLEQIALTIYGYAQNSREEYLFLKLIEKSIQLEVNDAGKVGEALKDNPLFIKLVLQYTRGVKEREYLRDLLRPLLDLIMKDDTLDLDIDPVSIYKGLIRQEEAATGEKSKRPNEITPEKAFEDQKVLDKYTENISKLKDLTNFFLDSIAKSVTKMPFGIRYVSMKIRESLKAKFPLPEHEKEINNVIGNLLYYRYINPVIIAPEAFDVIETSVSPPQRKNLAEVAKTLYQVLVGKSTRSEVESESSPGHSKSTSDYQQSLVVRLDAEFSKYLQTASPKFAKFMTEASTVVPSEEYFGMDEFHDSGNNGIRSKITIYVTPDEVIQLHNSLVEHVNEITTSPEDPLKIILNELGAAPAPGTAAKGPGSEIVLNLQSRFAKVSTDDQGPVKKLLKETKRLILLAIRFAPGANLLDVLETASTPSQQNAYADYVKRLEILKDEEMLKESKPSLNSPTSPTSPTSPESPGDVFASGNNPVYKNPDDSIRTFSEIKIKALENMAKLEEYDLVTKDDKYQSMLDKIVEDMLNKHRRRTQIHRELLSLQKTIANLQEKEKFLRDSIDSYYNYIDSCMQQLTSKKGKSKKAPSIFSKQYYHLQTLKKSGEVPKFGSFKYTAAELHKKGVLISIEDVAPNKLGMINLTISSNETGVFDMEVTLLGQQVEKEELRLEDLLQMQYNKEDVITLFDIAKVNLNLLIFLINKKFFA